MQLIDKLDFRSTGYFSNLICDYIEQKPELSFLYDQFPSKEAYRAKMEERASFDPEKRSVLCAQIRQSYQEASVTMQEEEQGQLEALAQSNSFTLVTGHQLNLFTGPIYFIYKIASIIKLSRILKADNPNHNFIPIYWMASEDHDFDEINHIHWHGGKLRWETGQTGAVGRMSTEGIQEVIAQLKELLGPGQRAQALVSHFRDSYSAGYSLAQATMRLVHHLFGQEGLLIVDADQAELKRLAIPYFKQELLQDSSFRASSAHSKWLSEHYFAQVNAREINLFYLRDGLRERIVKVEEQWTVLNSEWQFSESALLEELEVHPERFSPNVILRPLYQEIILPNLSYTGGGGELAYWLQLKGVFETAGVPFPLLHLRNSVLYVPKALQRKAKKLGVETPDLFLPLHELEACYVQRESDMPLELEEQAQTLEKMFAEMRQLAKQTDQTMIGAVEAQYAKQSKGLEMLKKRLLKAEKKRMDISMRQLSELKAGLFPAGQLQERYINFSQLYLEEGENFIPQLIDQLDPLDFRFHLLGETQ